MVFNFNLVPRRSETKTFCCDNIVACNITESQVYSKILSVEMCILVNIPNKPTHFKS